MKNSLYRSVSKIFLFTLFTTNYGFAQTDHEQALEKLDSSLKEISEIGLIKGYGVAIVSPDSTIFAKGYGMADVSNNIPYTPETLQNIGSVSKTLIGIALMKAQEMGKLKLDDPISKYLDFDVVNPFYPDEPIRIWHLATHTGGIKDTRLYEKKAYYVLDENDLGLDVLKKQSEDFLSPKTKATLAAYLENFLSKKGSWYAKKNYNKKKPGSTFRYSNVGAALAAHVVEKATGMPYDQFTSKYILSALNMNASGWAYDKIDASKHSVLYSKDGRPLPKYALVTYPDGGLITNLNDFGSYLSELMKGYYKKGTLLEADGYEALFQQRLEIKEFPEEGGNRYDDEFNSGIFMGFTPVGYVGHSGSDPGIVALMFFDPKLKLGHILMLNTSTSSDSVEKQLIPILKAIHEYLNAQK
ncbi:serine hydrolase domain-containing protein [Flagellimonas sp.]|uniref:serine hydrolase domain-containing protein n=1 Tax=Flagellimonas sp. TaxID=2058762 RepID=UPI003B5A36C9